MPDLRDLAKLILISLQGRIEATNPNCRFRRALTEIIQITVPSEDQWTAIDFAVSPDQWRDFESIAQRLVTQYAPMLDVTVDGEPPDYLLWDVLDAAHVYSNPTVEPDAEHLCLAALAIEGVASEMPTPNWDSLIERAVQNLAGDQPVLRVVVDPTEQRLPRKRANLYKFHGCALCACANPGQFRNLLIARQSQINAWVVNNPAIVPLLTNLIATKPTLMLGLSAQDYNIQALFAAAQAQMPWRWPSNTPAYAFSENTLGANQRGLLQIVYPRDYSAATRDPIYEGALVQAFAKPLLLSLLLYVMTSKLKLLVDIGAPDLQPSDQQALHHGLMHARDCLADVLRPSSEIALEWLLLAGRTMSMLRTGKLPVAKDGCYSPITRDPLELMPADPSLPGSGLCEFAIAVALIGIGMERGLWVVSKPDVADLCCGALTLTGRSGPAKFYFASSSNAAIRMHTDGLVADNDAVIVHSHEAPPAMPRYPRRAPGRTGLAAVREVGIGHLLGAGSQVEDLLERFRSEVAL